MLKSELVALVEVPTTIRGEDGQLKKAVGTAYPIRDGLVLTARHVLYHDNINAEKERIFSWRLSDADEPYHTAVVTQTDIVFEDADFDVAVVRCDTSKLTMPLSVLSDVFPKPKEPWTAMGYPRAGVEATQRKKTPAGGTCFMPDQDYYIQQLVSEGNADVGTLWKGMSGAPVFSCQTGKLLGVLIRTPNQYDKVIKYADGQKTTTVEAVFENRLVAASIPYLLRIGKCEKFRQAVWQSQVSQLLPTVQTGDEFKAYLTKKITRELKKRDQDTPRLCEQLSEALEMEDEGSEPKTLAKALIERKISKAIDVLATATADCVVPGGMRYKETDSIDEVKATAQQVLGWLVLGSFDEKQLDAILPHCIQHDSLFFTLAVKSLTGVEIVMARRFNRPSQFEHQTGPEQKSRHLIAPPTGSLKWDEKESAKLIFIEVWNKVFPSRKLDNRHYDPKPEDWERLNSELAARRDDSQPEHYYIPFKASAYDQAEMTAYVADVYRHFLSKLNQMTVIQYGEDGCDSNLFFIKEADLQAAINKFYRRIHGEKG